MELIAQGSALSSLGSYENLFQEGDKGEVRIYLSNSLSEVQVANLNSSIVNAGVLLTHPIEQVSRIIVIPFQKAFPPLAIIAAIIASIGAIILGWQLLRDTTRTLLTIAIIAGGGLLLLWLLR